MKIHALKIALTEEELASVAIPALSGYVKNLRVTCREGHVLAEGDASVAGMSAPVSLTVELSAAPDGKELVADIVGATAKLGPLPVPATAFVGQLLGLLPESPGVRVEGSSVRVSPVALLAEKGIGVDATFRSLEILSVRLVPG